MVSCLFDEVGYHFWLQNPFNHLGDAWRTSYIAAVLREILESLRV
jgi:hypothetical protein